MQNQTITGLTVHRLGYNNPTTGTDIPADQFHISGRFDFLTESDRDEFLDELRQAFEFVCPFGCTVEVTGIEFKKLDPRGADF